MKALRILLVLSLSVLLLAACARDKVDDGTARMSEAAGASSSSRQVDREEQKRKAVQSRLQAGIEALKSKDPERARRHISRALEIDSDSPEANNAMALLYNYEGDDRREEEYFRRAIRANGNYSQARNNYAVFLYRKERYHEAIEQLEKAANDTAYDQRAVAFLNLGRSYARVGELEKASSALQRSLRLESQRAETLIELAEVLLRQQRYADADNYLSMYQTRMRNTARSLWVGVRVSSALGNVDKVASYEFQLEKLFRQSPEYVEWRAWKNGESAGETGKRKSR